MKQGLYFYGMRLRGFSIGTYPIDGFLRCEHMSMFKDKYNIDTSKYYDVLVYDKELSEQDLLDYEFDLILEV